MEEQSAAVLRAELDLLKERLATAERRAEESEKELTQLILDKHSKAAGEFTAARDRLGKLELKQAVLTGDPDDKRDLGRVGRLEDTQTTLLARVDKAKLAIAAAVGGGGAGGLTTIGNLLGWF